MNTRTFSKSALTLGLILSNTLFAAPANTPDSGSILLKNQQEKQPIQSLPSKSQKTGMTTIAIVVADEAQILDAPDKKAAILKTLHKGEEIKLNGMLLDGYYELQEGGHIHKNNVKIISKILNISLMHRGEVRIKDSLVQKTFAYYTKDGVEADSLDAALTAIKNLGEIDGAIFLTPKGNDYDASLGIVEGKAYSGFVGVDNYGDHSTGVIRKSLAFASNDALGYGEKLSVYALTTGQNLTQGSLSASIPVSSDSSTVSAGVSKMTYRLADAFKDIDAVGSSLSLWAAYTKPLWLSYKGAANYSLKLSNNKMTDEINAFSTVTYRASNTLDNSITYTKGDEYMGGGTNSALVDLRIGRLEADISNDPYKKVGGYAKINTELQRAQRLGSFTGVASFKLQKAFRNLDSSEKFNLTGIEAVGGYYSGDIVGDEGYLLSFELAHPVTAIPNLTGSFSFVTGAVKTLYAPIDSSNNIQKASSAGVKLSYIASYGITANTGLYKRVSGELVNNHDSAYHFLFNLSKKF